jgi:L-idonate 5-dehydrogenase
MLGMPPAGEVPFLGNTVVIREITLRGSFRFAAEFDEALALFVGGLPVDGLVTGTFRSADAVAAFEVTGDRRRACKILLDLGSP